MIRDYEHKPRDKLNQIANELQSFNEKKVEIDGKETKISLEDILPPQIARQPTSTKGDRTDTKNPESIKKINKKTNTSIKKLVTREQNKCQETKDIIELVK